MPFRSASSGISPAPAVSILWRMVSSVKCLGGVVLPSFTWTTSTASDWPLCQTVRQGGVFGGGGIDPPAHVQHRFSFGGEAMPATLRRQAGFGVPMGRADRPEQPQRHQPQDFPLSLGERGEVGIGGAFGGDNGMVVRDVLTAAHLGR